MQPMHPQELCWEWAESREYVQIERHPNGWEISGRHDDVRFNLIYNSSFSAREMVVETGDGRHLERFAFNRFRILRL